MNHLNDMVCLSIQNIHVIDGLENNYNVALKHKAPR